LTKPNQRLYSVRRFRQELEMASKFVVESYRADAEIPEPPNHLPPMPPQWWSALHLSAKKPRVYQNCRRSRSYSNAEADGDFTIFKTNRDAAHSLYPDAFPANDHRVGRAITRSEVGRRCDLHKSCLQPRNLDSWQLGSVHEPDPNNEPEYEVIASNLRLELNKTVTRSPVSLTGRHG